MTSTDFRVAPKFLEGSITNMLKAVGTPLEIAKDVSEMLVDADQSGHTSHGIRQLHSRYADEIQTGSINPMAEPSMNKLNSSAMQVDGQRAFGHFVAKVATEAGITCANEQGVSMIGISNTAHIGRVGTYAEIAAAAGYGFIGLVANPESAWVAPPGSSQRRISTNPICLGMPTFGGLPFPLIADLSTSQVAHGKIKQRNHQDKPLEHNWAIKSGGGDLLDATKFELANEGALRPLGGTTAGYKGFALAIMNEFFAAVCTAGSVSGMEDLISGNHALFIIFDPTVFATKEIIAKQANSLGNYIRETLLDPGADFQAPGMDHKLLMPGEPEYIARTQSKKQGVLINKRDVESLQDLADVWGLKNLNLQSK